MSALLQLEALFDTSPPAAVGEVANLRVRVRNGPSNFTREAHVLVRADDALLLLSAAPWLRGDGGGRELAFVVPPLLVDETFEFVVSVFAVRGGDARISVRLDAEGSVHERELQCTCAQLQAFEGEANRFELFAADADSGAEVEGHVVLTNASGARAVAELRVDGELSDVRLDCEPVVELAPGTRRVVRVRGRVPAEKEDGQRVVARAFAVHRGRETPLGECALLVRARARFEGEIETSRPRANFTAAGERIAWQLRLTNAGRAAAGTLSLALRSAGSIYVPGSTTLDGARLIDAGGTSALWSTTGLVLEGFPPGHSATLTCETLVEPGASKVALSASVRCEGREVSLESPVFEVAPARLGGSGLAFHVRDALFAPPEGTTSYRRSARAALAPEAIRHLEGMHGLARHLWALGALCADSCDDPARSAAAGAARAALCSVFDRLSIKLRIPDYRLDAEDVLDAAASAAIARVLHTGEHSLAGRLASATALVAASGDGNDASIHAYREALRCRFASFADDRALIETLTKTDAALDECLHAVIAHETGRRST